MPPVVPLLHAAVVLLRVLVPRLRVLLRLWLGWVVVCLKGVGAIVGLRRVMVLDHGRSECFFITMWHFDGLLSMLRDVVRYKW